MTRLDKTLNALQKDAMRMTTIRRLKTCRNRATAMTEMVLALPLIFVALSLLFFVGRGVVRVQHTLVMDRYEAWREASRVHTGTATEVGQILYGTDYVPMGPTFAADQLNAAFLGNKAEQLVEIDSRVTVAQAAEQTLVEDADLSDAARDILQSLFDQTRQSSGISIRTTFEPDTIPLWTQMGRSVSHGHRRDHSPWSYSWGYNQTQVDLSQLQSQGFFVMELLDQNRMLYLVNGSGAEYYARISDPVDRGEMLDLWQLPSNPVADMTPNLRDYFLSALDNQLRELDPYAEADGRDRSNQNLAGAIIGIYLESDGYNRHELLNYSGPTPYWFDGYRWRSH